MRTFDAEAWLDLQRKEAPRHMVLLCRLQTKSSLQHKMTFWDRAEAERVPLGGLARFELRKTRGLSEIARAESHRTACAT